MEEHLLSKLLDKSPGEWQEQLHDEAAINKHQLDDEAAEQSQLFSNWASLAAIAHIHRKECERNYEEVKADIELKVRSDPSHYGLEEKTPKEAAFKATVLSQKIVKDAYENYLEAYSYDKVLSIAEKTFDGRKTMLRLEGDLWLGEYYSTTTIKEEQVEKFREKINDNKKRSGRRVRKNG